MSTNIIDKAEGGTAHTTAPVQASPAADAEFLDARGVEARFGLKRSLLYALLADGSIRGVSLRRHGQLRGKRLFDVASVRAFLHAQMQGGKQ
jgi:hypothetical protein